MEFATKKLIKQFDHVGIAVRDTDNSLKIYRDLLGAQVTTYKSVGTTRDYTYTQFVLGNQRIELIEPLGDSESFLTRFLNLRGEGLHHLTFRVEDIRATAEHLKSLGLRVTDEFYEDPAWRTAFISPRSTGGVLIQLYQTERGSDFDLH